MDGLIDRGIDMDNDGTLEFQPEPGCLPGSCLDGVDNDNDGDTDIVDPQCVTNQVQNWTDLFFQADVPEGTSLAFDVCTAATEAELSGCTYTRIVNVTSVSVPCTPGQHDQCLGQDVGGGEIKDGFCGAGGQCQFVDPAKVTGFCTDDSQCDATINGTVNGFNIDSTCDTALNQCVLSTPPADLGSPLVDVGGDGKPFAKVRVVLNSNDDASATPTLYEWYLTYFCRSSQ